MSAPRRNWEIPGNFKKRTQIREFFQKNNENTGILQDKIRIREFSKKR